MSVHLCIYYVYYNCIGVCDGNSYTVYCATTVCDIMYFVFCILLLSLQILISYLLP